MLHCRFLFKNNLNIGKFRKKRVYNLILVAKLSLLNEMVTDCIYDKNLQNILKTTQKIHVLKD